MAVNATLNLALDRTSGRFSVDEGSTRLYVYDAAIDLSVGGWTRDEVAIGQDGKTMYEPYFQIVCGGMVLAEAKLNGVENPEEGEDEYFMTGTLSTNTVQMAAMFCGCAASETMRQFEARIFSTTSANPIATGRVSVWSFPSGGSNPANLPSASEALAALRTDLDNHTENEDIHVTAQEKAAWTNKQNALTFDSAPTEDSQNPVTSGGVKAALDAEAQARAQNDTALGNAISAEATARHAADDELGEDIAEERDRAEGEENRIQGDLNTHKENLTIHVTGTDKANWNAKVDPAAVAGFIDGAALGTGDYKNVLYLKHGNTVVAQVDMARFAIDGMVDSVYISSGGNLVITFNTDSGKQPINIPLTDIFNPENYYDKTAADARFVQKETGKGLSTNDYTDADKAKVDNAATVAAVDSKLAGKRDKTDLVVYDGAAAWDLSVIQALYPTLTIGVAVGYYWTPTGLKYKWFISGDGTAMSASEEIYDTEAAANAATQFTAQGSSDYPELAGVVVEKRATAGTDTLVKSSQLSNFALKADATLTERGFSAWAWEGTPPTYEGKEIVLRLDDYPFGPDDPGRCWVAYTADGEQCSASGAPATRDDDNTKTTVTVVLDGGVGSYTATRTALTGYQLGSQSDKPLASEAEAEALRTAVAAKQDALSAQQLANIAAVPGKLDKSGGTMTGEFRVGALFGGNFQVVPEIIEGGYTPPTMRFGDGAGVVGIIWRIVDGGVVMDVQDILGTTYRIALPSASGTLALTADLPYAIAAVSSNTLADRTVNTATVDAATYTPTFPTETSGKSCDFYLALTSNTAGAMSATGKTFKNAKGEAADMTYAANATTIFHFMQTATNTYLVQGGNNGCYTLPTASAATLGGVKVGDGLAIDDNGVLTSNPPAFIIVTAATRDGVTVTGQTVSVYNTDTSTLIGQKTYSGQPVSFEIRRGASYRVEITDTLTTRTDGLYDHFAPNVATGMAVAADTYVTLTYLDGGHIESPTEFERAKTAIKAQYDTDARRIEAGLEFLVGSEVPDTWTKDDGTTTVDDPLVCVDFGECEGEDGTTFLGATLMRKWATVNSVAFDNRNQEVAAEDTAQEGIRYYGFGAPYDATAQYAKQSVVSYDGHLYINSTATPAGGETWDATHWTDCGILTNGRIGPYDTTATYALGALCHYTDAARGFTGMYKCTTAISTAEAWNPAHWTLRAFDALEAWIVKLSTLSTGDTLPKGNYAAIFRTSLNTASGTYVQNAIHYGHNNYGTSAQRQYFNSAAAKGEWWEQKHAGQIAPNNLATVRGYMAGCSEELLGLVKKVKVPCYANDNTDSAQGAYTVADKFFLPSGTNMCGSVNANEGSVFPYMVRYLVEALEDAGKTVETYDSTATSEAGKIYVNRSAGLFYVSNGSGGYTNVTNDDKNNTTTGGLIALNRRRFSVANHSSAASCRLRSASRGTAHAAWFVNSPGNLSSNAAVSACTAVPACVI